MMALYAKNCKMLTNGTNKDYINAELYYAHKQEGPTSTHLPNDHFFQN